MITLYYERETKFGVFRDSLVLPEDHGMSEDQLEALRQNRVNEWIESITAHDATQDIITDNTSNGEQ